MRHAISGDPITVGSSQASRLPPVICTAKAVTNEITLLHMRLRCQQRERRDRQPYAITDAGREAFATWVAQQPGPETIRFPLLLTVLFGRHLPRGRLAEFLAAHRAAHAERLAMYEQVSAALPPQAARAEPYVLATLQFGLGYERAVLDWFDHLPAALREPAPGHDHGHITGTGTGSGSGSGSGEGTGNATRQD